MVLDRLGEQISLRVAFGIIMTMNKVVFIVPGFSELTSEEKYQKIARYFKKTNITPIIVDINWKRKVMSEYVQEFLTKYEQKKSEINYFWGFSFGAVICFIASSKVEVDTQILCSLSPFFSEDIPMIRPAWLKYWGKKRTGDFKKIHSEDLVKTINAKTILLTGSKEGKEITATKNRIYQLLICKKEQYIIKNAKHDISNPDYQKKVEKIILSL